MVTKEIIWKNDMNMIQDPPTWYSHYWNKYHILECPNALCKSNKETYIVYGEMFCSASKFLKIKININK